jgi:hypothetical protein
MEGFITYDTQRITYCSVVAPKDIQDRRGLIYCKAQEMFINAIEGWLYKIEREDGEYDGQKTFKIKFYFRNKSNEVIVLQSGRNSSFARSIINSLANLDQIGWTRFTPFVTESVKTNKKYIHGAVRHSLKCEDLSGDAFKIKKKFGYEEIPKLEELTFKKKDGTIKTDIDSSLIDAFYEDLIDKVIPIFKNQKPIPSADYEYVLDDDGNRIPF